MEQSIPPHPPSPTRRPPPARSTRGDKGRGEQVRISRKTSVRKCSPPPLPLAAARLGEETREQRQEGLRGSPPPRPPCRHTPVAIVTARARSRHGCFGGARGFYAGPTVVSSTSPPNPTPRARRGKGRERERGGPRDGLRAPPEVSCSWAGTSPTPSESCGEGPRAGGLWLGRPCGACGVCDESGDALLPLPPKLTLFPSSPADQKSYTSTLPSSPVATMWRPAKPMARTAAMPAPTAHRGLPRLTSWTSSIPSPPPEQAREEVQARL